MGRQTVKRIKLTVSLCSGVGAATLLLGTLLGLGSLHCGGRGNEGTKACTKACEMYHTCHGASSRTSGAGATSGDPADLRTCVTSCLQSYEASGQSTSGGTSSGESSGYRVLVQCAADATTCAAYSACFEGGGSGTGGEECRGSADGCSSSPGSCSSQQGCYLGFRTKWNGSQEEVCKGSPTACSSIYIRWACTRQSGCRWR